MLLELHLCRNCLIVLIDNFFENLVVFIKRVTEETFSLHIKIVAFACPAKEVKNECYIYRAELFLKVCLSCV